jgi:hypothetical protein
VIDLDDSMENADWIKRRAWDLPTTLGGILSIAGSSVKEVEHFLTLPSAEAMPDGLRARVMQYLKNAKAAESETEVN